MTSKVIPHDGNLVAPTEEAKDTHDEPEFSAATTSSNRSDAATSRNRPKRCDKDTSCREGNDHSHRLIDETVDEMPLRCERE